MKKHTFRVLIMDEKDNVLKRLKKEIKRNSIQQINDIKWTIIVETLLIEFEKEDDVWKIHKNTIANISKLTQQPFDLIFSDYGFIADSEALEALNNKVENEGHILKEEDFSAFLLSVSDIKNRFEELNMKEYHSINSKTNRCFFGHKAPVYIYTYTNATYEQFLPINNSGQVETELKEVFPNAKNVKYILTWGELFNRTEFQHIHDDNPNYYPFILSKHLTLLIESELHKKIINHQRFLGVKATTKITALVILIGVLCGAFGEFVGKSVVEAIESGSWVSITAFTILGLIITAIVAYFMWKIPENFITQVLNKEEDQ